MTPEQTAEARARGYALLAQLLLEGPAGVDRAVLATLADEVPPPDELAAQFVAAFDLGVPPYASVFLERDGCVGGEVTRGIMDAMAANGRAPVTLSVGACHLGVLVAHVAQLCRDGDDERAVRFLRAHVLGWLPSYVAALRSVAAPFWLSVVSLGLQMVSEHVDGHPSCPPLRLPIADPEPDPLQDDHSGLRDVAVYLSHPARCGLFITDANLTTIGRVLDLPRGFGTRHDRLETLLRSAAEYDSMVQLCEALGALLQTRLATLEELCAGHAASSSLRPWRDRIQRTTTMLNTLEAGAHSVATQGRAAQ